VGALNVTDLHAVGDRIVDVADDGCVALPEQPTNPTVMRRVATTTEPLSPIDRILALCG